MKTSMTLARSTPPRSAWALWAGLHALAVVGVAFLLALLMIPMSTLEWLTATHMTTPELMQRSAPAILLHLGLAACVWALLVILFKLAHRSRPLVVHSLSARGSVMTETLIVLPVFLLLSMGLTQLAINNIAAILANVAVHQAARTAWLWQPEAGKKRVTKEISDNDVQDRARIAAALVMTPVAPGNFVSNPLGSQAFSKARFAQAASQLPFAGAAGHAGELLAGIGAIDPTIATRGNLTLTRALDQSSFLQRSVQKFTHAYEATKIEVTQSDGRIGVKLTYKLHQTVPFVRNLLGSFGHAGLRVGYFATYTREYSFKAQPYAPNASLPDSGFFGTGATRSGGDVADVDIFGF